VIDDAMDDPAFGLLGEWPRCCEFIDAALHGQGSVLIHCDAGSSRSGATLVAYLVHRLRRPCGECLSIAQRARDAVAPNEGFWAQLLTWERNCLGNAFVPSGARMHEIRPRLWLGSVDAAQDWQQLQECGITHVLTCGRGLETQLPAGIQRLGTLSIDDLDEVDILEHLPRCSDLIGNTLKQDSTYNVLVHCAAGASRSASIVIAYIMREERLSFTDAYHSVASIRSVVQPNASFTRQLAWYGRNGCPANLRDKTDGSHYSAILEFKTLLRKYSASDVRALVFAAGLSDDACKDPKVLERALAALDRLMNAVPLDAEARKEKSDQSRWINAALDNL